MADTVLPAKILSLFQLALGKGTGSGGNGNIDNVMNGDLDGFINAYLSMKAET